MVGFSKEKREVIEKKTRGLLAGAKQYQGPRDLLQGPSCKPLLREIQIGSQHGRCSRRLQGQMTEQQAETQLQLGNPATLLTRGRSKGPHENLGMA